MANTNTFGNLEAGLKIARLISTVETSNLLTTIADAKNIIRILAGAPYGANVKRAVRYVTYLRLHVP